MPKVGNKHFPYTKAGKAAAKAAAVSTGKGIATAMSSPGAAKRSDKATSALITAKTKIRRTSDGYMRG